VGGGQGSLSAAPRLASDSLVLLNALLERILSRLLNDLYLPRPTSKSAALRRWRPRRSVCARP